MKNTSKLLLLAALPLILSACTTVKTAKNVLSTNVQTVARDQGDALVVVALTDKGHYDDQSKIVYDIEFKENALLSAFSLEGGLKGKEIVSLTMSEDKHTMAVGLKGKCSDMNATEGEIVFNTDAYTAVNSEYEGFTFYTTIKLADSTEYILPF